jgi:hypothetical protein
LHLSLVKAAVSLQEPLLDGRNDSIVISDVFRTKATLHWAKRVKM